MIRLPRSLFGRHALLLVVLLLLGQAVSVVVLQRLRYQPRVEHTATLVARQIEAVQGGLAALPPAQRAGFVERFNRAVQAPVQEDESRRATTLAPLDREFIRALSERLAKKGVQVERRAERADLLHFGLNVEGQMHWVVLSDVVPGRAFSGALVVMLVGSTLLGVAAALWLQRWLNRPLERVVQAAQVLAEEATPEPLPEDGPLEIATVSRSFNRLVESLAQAERERALMLAGVSHDLRTPLTKVRLGVEILRGHTREAELLGSMARSIEEMDDIVGQFLELARPQAGTMASSHSLDELAQALAEAFADHGRTVVLSLGRVPVRPMQPQAMQRVMRNLLENAWKYGRPPVELRTFHEAGADGFEVRDHGPGVPPEELPRLRQPFFRGASARGHVAGAGLGLAIAERIVRQHGGQLELQNLPGGGLSVRALFQRTGLGEPQR